MESPIINIRQGKLRGAFRSDINGCKFLSFLGIPYAKPPLGELRFKAPLPGESWNGIRDATQEGDICYSREDFTSNLKGSEDCLNLNVFTKKLPQSNERLKPVMVYIHGGGFVSGSKSAEYWGPEFLMTEDIVLVSINYRLGVLVLLPQSNERLKPVMVYIHGGGFVSGSKSAEYWGPEFLMTEDVVLVSINYRLGVLGFLSLEDTSLEVPGNAGMKDQVLALKWVQENIEYFNGDPRNVTLFGSSAGAGATHFHMLSQSSKDLFHKAVLQSGTALNYWAYGSRNSKELAKYLGHEVNDERETLEILRKTPVERLFEAQESIKEEMSPSKRRPFGPIIEKPNDTAFITKEAIDIILSEEYNKVPMLIGYTTREGLLAEVGRPAEIEPIKLGNGAVPWQVNLKEGSEALRRVRKKIESVYFKGPDEVDDELVLKTDSVFVAGIMAAVKNHAATSEEPIFLYRMSLDAGLNFLKTFAKLDRFQGACHADELGYLFKNFATPETKPASLEHISIRRFVKLWTNFAKYGNPTPNEKELGVIWKPVEEGKFYFLDIGKELILGVNPEAERMALWREIYQLNPATEKFL